ncbi:MAG: BlaI/MecI/CopY family transcriptional regulator [Ilumatobacteraceae bacterium]|nr:BlaI/MecI/CopY family transcriptional regulator [Ilumatobacteraceae bacterium]
MARRADGALEREVLAVLWDGDGAAMTPTDVLGQIDGELAYTTVMTVLSRLHDKGLTHRERRGRAFAYTATVTESELVASRMRTELASSRDRTEALSGFVSRLDRRDRAALRRLLGPESP